MVRIKDVADYVGVSTATVSNVINGKDQRVSPAMRKKIRDALDEMGYVRNRSAMMLAQTSSNMIGVVIPQKPGVKITLEDPYYSALLGNLEYEIRQHGCYMYLITQQSESEIIHHAIAWNLEGLIVCNMPEDELKSLCEKYNRTVVSIDSYFDKADNIVNIMTDDFGGGYKMGRYLAESGHKKVAMLADNDYSVDHNRWCGLCTAMKESGVQLTEKDHFIFSSSEPVRELQLEQFFPQLMEYTALFIASDFYALEVVSFMQSKGVKIPEDISVTGFDDLIYARLSRPKLTTLSQNLSQKALMAVESLLDPNINVKTLEVKLVERESVKKIIV